jgi:hypothetical protein
MQQIGSYYFANSEFTTLKIPSCLMALDPGSFHSCQLLEKATFEQDSRLKEILGLCFSGCGLEFIMIPK